MGPAGKRAKVAKSSSAAKRTSRIALRSMAFMPGKGILAAALVIEIAVHKKKYPLNATALSDRLGFPPRYFEPVLQALVRKGILKSARGPSGGYELARKPARITLKDIFRPMGLDAMAKSTLHRKKRVMRAVVKTQHALSMVLARISVEDLAPRRRK